MPSCMDVSNHWTRMNYGLDYGMDYGLRTMAEVPFHPVFYLFIPFQLCPTTEESPLMQQSLLALTEHIG